MNGKISLKKKNYYLVEGHSYKMWIIDKSTLCMKENLKCI